MISYGLYHMPLTKYEQVLVNLLVALNKNTRIKIPFHVTQRILLWTSVDLCGPSLTLKLLVFILRDQISIYVFIYKHRPIMCHWSLALMKTSTLSITYFQGVSFVLTHYVLSDNVFCNSLYMNYSAFHEFKRVQIDNTLHRFPLAYLHSRV